MKKMISVLIIITLIINCAIFTSYAEKSKSNIDFKNVDELRQRIYEIFEKDYDKFFEYSSRIKTLEGGYEHFTYEMNCGACSNGFQYLLYENGLVAENMQFGAIEGHMYNFMRVTFSDSPDKVSSVIIDTTYKQYLTSSYEYDYEKMQQDLPPVLVYEFNNPKQLFEQLCNMKSSVGEEKYTAKCEELLSLHTIYEYRPQNFQQLAHKEKREYTAQFMDDLRNNGGYTPKLSDDLFICDTNSQLKKEMSRDLNGVYRCYLSVDEASLLSSGFTVNNAEGKVIFGGQDSEKTLKYIPSSGFVVQESNQVLLLKKDSTFPVFLNTYGTYLPVLLSLDLRAGEETPAVFAYNVNRVLQYGDVDTDGEITVYDVTKLQKAIANQPSSQLDLFSIETANVLTIEPLSIFNATEISRYLAKYNSEKCGHTLYFSGTTEISLTNSMGFVDV